MDIITPGVFLPSNIIVNKLKMLECQWTTSGHHSKITFISCGELGTLCHFMSDRYRLDILARNAFITLIKLLLFRYVTFPGAKRQLIGEFALEFSQETREVFRQAPHCVLHHHDYHGPRG